MTNVSNNACNVSNVSNMSNNQQNQGIVQNQPQQQHKYSSNHISNAPMNNQRLDTLYNN